MNVNKRSIYTVRLENDTYHFYQKISHLLLKLPSESKLVIKRESEYFLSSVRIKVFVLLSLLVLRKPFSHIARIPSFPMEDSIRTEDFMFVLEGGKPLNVDSFIHCYAIHSECNLLNPQFNLLEQEMSYLKQYMDCHSIELYQLENKLFKNQALNNFGIDF